MMILKTSRSNLSSNDQLSLDLPFAATKSLTARVGPTPTFTRGSGATYIGSDGLIHGVDTSTTSNTIGTGSRTFTLAATAGQDQFWRAGDAVEASNGSNFMTGTVTSYDAATQSLVCNMTSTGGSGTFTSWRIGYRGPRFDHDSAGVCRGLLIEESRTNLFSRSEEFNSSPWGVIDAIISANSTTSPNGLVTADKIVVNSGATNGRVAVSFTLTGSHAMSVFAKAGEWSWVFLAPIGPGNGVWFNLSNGSIGTQSSGFVGSITSFGNGWYRCVVTFTGTGASASARIVSTNSNSVLSTGDGTSGIFIWGAQLEAGLFATSYIPTVASPMVRSADVCSISGGNFSGIWSGVDATMFFRGSRIANQTGQTNWDLSSGSTATSIASDRGVSTERIVANAVGIATTPVFTTLTEYKIAAALKTGDYAVSFNGASAITSSSAFVLTLDRMTIGMTRNTAGHLNGWVHSLRFYKKRLPNAKLAQLTV
jgi:hypothetical protein